MGTECMCMCETEGKGDGECEREVRWVEVEGKAGTTQYLKAAPQRTTGQHTINVAQQENTKTKTDENQAAKRKMNTRTTPQQ